MVFAIIIILYTWLKLVTIIFAYIFDITLLRSRRRTHLDLLIVFIFFTFAAALEGMSAIIYRGFQQHAVLAIGKIRFPFLHTTRRGLFEIRARRHFNQLL